MNACRTLLAVALLALGMPLAAAGREVVLVVDAGSPVEHLDAIEVRTLFLQLPVHRSDRPLRPILNASDPQLKRVFLQHVVAMSQRAYDHRILGDVLQHGRSRPVELRTLDHVLAALYADQHAVSYVWAHQVANNPRIRVIRVLWRE